MQIHKIVVPTPFTVGPVNVYLVRHDPLTLIDVGPNTPEAFAALREGVEALGLRLDMIRRIVVSHGHEDHYGLAGRIQEMSGAEVLIHHWEIEKIFAGQDYSSHLQLLRRAGVPAEALVEFELTYLKFRPFASESVVLTTVEDEAEIIFDSGSLRVLHTPGHTPGSICLMRESNREVIAADTIIRHITPNPMLSCDPLNKQRRFPSLGEYLCSIARIKELAPTHIYCGHGTEIADYGEHFHRLINKIQSRQQTVLQLIGKNTLTTWEVSGLMFPQVKNAHRYLAVSEAQAHLDAAVADGRLIMEKRDDVEVFRAVY